MNEIRQAIENAAPPDAVKAETDAKNIIERAIEQTKADPGAPFEPEVVTALAEVRQASPADYLRHRQAFKKANRDVLLGELDRLVRAENLGGDDDPSSIADVMVSLVTEKADLFTDEEQTAYAAFRQDDHREVWPLDSKGFREWLGYAFYREYGKAPRDASVKDAIATLAGIATHDGETRPVFLRCAPNPTGEGYIIDLCDEEWRVIEVTPTGWRVLDESPVMFRRTKNMKPLPVPEAGGKIDDLWEFANIATDDRGLVIAWMLEAFRPDTPFPVLEIGGEQGSAKSTTQKSLRNLIDPSSNNLRATPKTDEDVFVSAAANWLASYNNLSHLSASRQDALCTLATGGGYGGRKLFTNAEESVWEAKRPVVINGISTLVTAPDLLDRTIRTESPRLTKYISESALIDRFEAKRAGIFGALLDLFVKALAILPSVEIERPPRMTDFAHFGEAVYLGMGREQGTFLADYQRGREAAVSQSIEASPVASAVLELAQHGEFEGTVGHLLDRLDDFRPRGDTGWPKSAKGLADALRRYAPPLRLLGVAVEFEAKGRHGRKVRIYVRGVCVEPPETNVTTVTTVTPSQKGDDGDGCDDQIRRFDTHPPDTYTADETITEKEGFIL